METSKNVPQWILNSTTGIEKQNDEVGLIVARYIGAFRKRGFTEKEIGILLASAFLLSAEEVEKRVDSVLSCGDDGDEAVRRLCVFTAEKGHLFDVDNTDPCEIISLLQEWYGKTAAFDTLLTFPQLLSLWKREDVRENPQYEKQKIESEKILKECASVFPKI